MQTEYLEITLKIDDIDRSAAAGVYAKYKKPFLDTVSGALSKELLLREDDVQVLHGFAASSGDSRPLRSSVLKRVWLRRSVSCLAGLPRAASTASGSTSTSPSKNSQIL